MKSSKGAFTEIQKFTQWWIWTLLVGLVLLPVYGVANDGAAAAVLEGKTVHPGVHAMVVPGSGLVKLQAEEEGLDLEEFLNSLRRAMMEQALRRTDGQQKRAAGLLRQDQVRVGVGVDEPGGHHVPLRIDTRPAL